LQTAKKQFKQEISLTLREVKIKDKFRFYSVQ